MDAEKHAILAQTPIHAATLMELAKARGLTILEIVAAGVGHGQVSAVAKKAAAEAIEKHPEIFQRLDPMMWRPDLSDVERRQKADADDLTEADRYHAVREQAAADALAAADESKRNAELARIAEARAAKSTAKSTPYRPDEEPATEPDR